MILLVTWKSKERRGGGACEKKGAYLIVEHRLKSAGMAFERLEVVVFGLLVLSFLVLFGLTLA